MSKDQSKCPDQTIYDLQLRQWMLKSYFFLIYFLVKMLWYFIPIVKSQRLFLDKDNKTVQYFFVMQGKYLFQDISRSTIHIR